MTQWDQHGGYLVMLLFTPTTASSTELPVALFSIDIHTEIEEVLSGTKNSNSEEIAVAISGHTFSICTAVK